MKSKRITKKHILREIRLRYPKATGTIGKTALGKGVINLECNHGEADRIGQFCLQYFGSQVYTYFACHIFRRAHLTIYSKR